MFCQRIVAEMAYDLVKIFYPVCVYPFGWQQEGKDENDTKYFYGIFLKRSLARGELDLYCLGNHAGAFGNLGQSGCNRHKRKQ